MKVSQPQEPPVGTILETRDSIDEYRIERTRGGWAIQYREGENEFGQPLTNGRISWGSAWRAWLGGGSQPVRQVQPGDPPLPPYEEEDDPYAGMGIDESDCKFGDGKFDPPPAAQPWTPKGADVNEATKGAVEGVSTVTPTGLATAAASEATDKDIKSPLQMSLSNANSEVQAAEQALAKNDTAANRDWVTSITGARDALDWTVNGKDSKTTSAAAATGGATSSGGTGMSHAEEGNAQIQQAGQDIEAAAGAIQEIVNQLEAAQQNLTGAAEGSQHSEADTAMGALQEAVSKANDLLQQVGAAQQAVEDVRL